MFKKTCLILSILYSYNMNLSCDKSFNPIQQNTIYDNPKLITPLNNAEYVPINCTLSWSCENAVNYDVCLDTLSPPVEYIAQNYDKDSIEAKNLKFNKSYYWKIIAFFPNGDSTESEIGSFKTKGVFPLTASNLYIKFPDVELNVRSRWTWNDFYGFSQGVDTLNIVDGFSFNPFLFEDSIKSFYTNENLISFCIKKFSSAGNISSKDSTNGWFYLDTLHRTLDLKIYFYQYDHQYFYYTSERKETTESSIIMVNVPYMINDNGYINVLLQDQTAISLVAFFNYSNYSYQRQDAAWGDESVTLLNFLKFVDNSAIEIKVYF